MNSINNPFGKVFYIAQCPSTMTLIDHHFEEGMLVLTNLQNKGVGRLPGRVWQAEEGQNILATILLKPTIGLPLTFYLAKAVVSLVEKQQEVKIKWPNDVLVGGKKLSGILCQYKNGLVKAGFGINVNQTQFNALKACSLASLNGHVLNREEVLNTFLANLYSFINKGLTEEEINPYLYKKDELMTYQVSENETVEGMVRGVNSQGHLGLETLNGFQWLVSGESI